jgi:DNA-binding NtrC family response regulator
LIDSSIIAGGSTMEPVTTVERQRDRPREAYTVLAQERDRGVEDEYIAGRSAAALLITAWTRDAMETLARRIHEASFPSPAPFVRVRAGVLPSQPRMFRENCSALLDAATGGSVFITDVEETPAGVQSVLIELLDERQRARVPAPARVISGTTVSLVDRIAAGTFSEQLFYRLNLIHLVSRDGAPSQAV